jgi:hypothetical protein
MSDKLVDKTVVVLHRMEPIAGHFEEAKKISEEWFEFVKKIPDCKGVDLICCVEGRIAWFEEWTSKAAVDKFNEEHLPYADYAVRLMSCSRVVPSRPVYRKVG